MLKLSDKNYRIACLNIAFISNSEFNASTMNREYGNTHETRHVRKFRVTGRTGIIRADLIVTSVGRMIVNGSFTTLRAHRRYSTNIR